MKAKRMFALMMSLTMVLGVATGAAFAAAPADLVAHVQQDAEVNDHMNLAYHGGLELSQVAVNVQSGEIRFLVNDWPASEEGTRPAMIQGTLVCQASAGANATLVETPAVPLSEDGRAFFAGPVSMPAACAAAPQDLAFFVKTAPAGE